MSQPGGNWQIVECQKSTVILPKGSSEHGVRSRQGVILAYTHCLSGSQGVFQGFAPPSHMHMYKPGSGIKDLGYSHGTSWITSGRYDMSLEFARERSIRSTEYRVINQIEGGFGITS